MAKNEVLTPEALVKMLTGSITGTVITGDEVEFYDGNKMILPKGMTFEQAARLLERLQKDAETPTRFDRKFRYRSDDGAYAAFMVVKERYGMLLGKEGDKGAPSQTRNINIAFGHSMQVPWGTIELPTLPGLEVTLCDQHADPDYGQIFEIHAEGPRKYKDEINTFFNDVQKYLELHSIYRGKAIIGSDRPEFLDLSAFDPSKIVFSDEVTAILEGQLWAPIRYTQSMRSQGVPLKRSVLLEGPFGTGKTSAGQITAKVAVDNGWTFISAKPGRDKVEDVLRTARLYQPSVVFVEDIDNATSSAEDDEVTSFLDAFDGITAKGGEMIAVMTTNHIERIHKGMLRPGRLDAVVKIAGLDRNGVERLIKAVIPAEKMESKVDFDQVYQAMDGFYPAFVREAVTRSVVQAIARLKGGTNYKISTQDLVLSAHSLRPQLDILNEAEEGEKKSELEAVFNRVVKDGIDGIAMTQDDDGDWALRSKVN